MTWIKTAVKRYTCWRGGHDWWFRCDLPTRTVWIEPSQLQRMVDEPRRPPYPSGDVGNFFGHPVIGPVCRLCDGWAASPAVIADERPADMSRVEIIGYFIWGWLALAVLTYLIGSRGRR